MPPALTPELALAYVRELSADVRAVVALSGSGERLAGDAGVAAAARALLGAAPDAAELEIVTANGVACAVRGTRHSLVAACGPFALPGVVRQDLRAALGALEPDASPPAAPAADAAQSPAADAAQSPAADAAQTPAADAAQTPAAPAADAALTPPAPARTDPSTAPTNTPSAHLEGLADALFTAAQRAAEA